MNEELSSVLSNLFLNLLTTAATNKEPTIPKMYIDAKASPAIQGCDGGVRKAISKT